MKIVLTGGGTAGHVSGNMALVPELKKRGFTIDYIGTMRGIERTIVAKDPDITYHPIMAGRLIRQICVQNFKNIFKFIRGVKEARELINEIKPDIVFSKGGYVTVPVVMAAHKCKIPVIIHESDYTPGLANKIATKYASKVCTTFKETTDMFKKDKAVWTGSPLRDELFSGNKVKGYAITGFDSTKPVILVMGGSSGALAINNLVRASVYELTKKFNIIHICGKGGSLPEYNNIPGYKQFDYVTDELPHLFAITDMAVSRAGANAIFEFLAANIPMLLIPLPKDASRGDQILNAESFSKRGFAIMRDQNALNKDNFTDSVNELYSRKDEIKETMKKSAVNNGKKQILDLIFAEYDKTCKK